MSKLTLKELEDIGRTMYMESYMSISPLQPLYVPRKIPLNFVRIDLEDASGYISLIDKNLRKEYITYCTEFMQHDYILGERYIFFTNEQDLLWFKLRFM